MSIAEYSPAYNPPPLVPAFRAAIESSPYRISDKRLTPLRDHLPHLRWLYGFCDGALSRPPRPFIAPLEYSAAYEAGAQWAKGESAS